MLISDLIGYAGIRRSSIRQHFFLVSLDVTTRFDCVFWTGDLNFRIEVYKGKQAVEDIVQSIQEQEHPNFEDLVAGDQLTQLIVEGK